MWEHSVELGIASPPLWLFSLGCAVGFGVLTGLGTLRSFADCELEPRQFPVWSGISSAVLVVLTAWAVCEYHSQRTPEVIPSAVGENWRLVYHMSLMSLLVMVTATDLKSYFILEWPCYLGVAVGLTGAVLSGEFQLSHVWVDWNAEIPQLRGPYFPEWLAQFPHLHGLAWSTAGLGVGVIVTWGTRQLSSMALGTPTLGSGDVLLMAMIGAYLGWQPTLIAFALAPLFAVLIGLPLKVLSNRPILPYGPFLAAGAVTTLACWKWIWMLEIPLTATPNPPREAVFAIRRFFGDWMSLLATVGLAVTLLASLLLLLRIYKSLKFH